MSEYLESKLFDFWVIVFVFVKFIASVIMGGCFWGYGTKSDKAMSRWQNGTAPHDGRPNVTPANLTANANWYGASWRVGGG
jgi:hypothetical protein